MPSKLFAGLAVIAAVLATSVGSQAGADPKPPSATCDPTGNTVIDYNSRSTFVTIDWFDAVGGSLGPQRSSLHGGGKFPFMSPAGAVSFSADVTTTTGVVNVPGTCP
jgi:hypothetical protein